MKRVLILSLLTLGMTTLAYAQAPRTWVSGVGDDANPCSRTAPCKTFAGAISKTASPGIINCLDPGGFGAVTITKSVMIDCTGTLGSVLSSGVQGIIVNALTTDNVILRNIDINGAGTTLGTSGVNVVQAASVQLQNVYIETYSSRGLVTTNTSNAISVMIENSNISNVGGIAVLGGSVSPGTTKMNINNSFVGNSGNGIDFSAQSSSCTVNNSTITRNAGVGFQIENPTSVGFLEGNTISYNGTGVSALAGVTLRLSRNAVFGSTTNGIGTAGGTTKCFSNNVIDGNTGSNACSSTPNTQQ